MVLGLKPYCKASSEFRKQVMVRMHPIIPLVEKQAKGFDLSNELESKQMVLS